MAKTKSTKPKRRYSRKAFKAHRHRPDTIHLIPDAMYASAAALPFITTAPGTSQSAVEVIGAVARGETPIGEGVQNFITATLGNVRQDIVPMAELAVVGYAIQYAAKKVGLNRVGTKRVKIA